MMIGKFIRLFMLGKLDGEFYTPRRVVCLLVEKLEPYGGRIYGT